jgi:hypothetical protein
MKSHKLSGKKLVPSARVAHVGRWRDPGSLFAVASEVGLTQLPARHPKVGVERGHRSTVE